MFSTQSYGFPYSFDKAGKRAFDPDLRKLSIKSSLARRHVLELILKVG